MTNIIASQINLLVLLDAEDESTAVLLSQWQCATFAKLESSSKRLRLPQISQCSPVLRFSFLLLKILNKISGTFRNTAGSPCDLTNGDKHFEGLMDDDL